MDNEKETKRESLNQQNDVRLYKRESSIKDYTFDGHAIKQQVYMRHNSYRSLHSSPLLCWSSELAEFAQNWAEKIAEKGYLQYSENPVLGENITIIDLQNQRSAGDFVVDEWYKERKLYNYNIPGWSKATFHFSQVVWRSTSEIGVGVKKLKNQNRVAIVVNYKPPGNNNLPGEYEKNVVPPRELNLREIKKRDSCQNEIQ